MAGPVSFLSKLKDKWAGIVSGGQFGFLPKVKEIALRLGVILSGIVFVVVLLLWGGLAVYGNSLTSQINSLKKKQAEVFSDQDIKSAANIVAFDKGAALVQKILKTHIYPSGIFDKLSAVTLPNVQWQSFDADISSNSIRVSGFVSDYSSLAKQILALEDGGFLNIKITNIALDKTGGVGFVATFNFDPKILQK